MTNSNTIDIAKDFSPFPAGRHRRDGPFSGEMFRDDVLVPTLGRGDKVTLILDGVAGLPSSFLEEVFGGIIRIGFSSLDALVSKLTIETTDPELKIYIPMAWKFAREANQRISK